MTAPTSLVGSRVAADILGVAVPTVSRYVADGILVPEAKLDGRSGAFVFDRQHVDEVAAELAAWNNTELLVSGLETRTRLGVTARQLIALVTSGQLAPAGRHRTTGTVLFRLADVDAAAGGAR